MIEQEQATTFANVAFIIFIFCWALYTVSSLKLCGFTETYQIPKEIFWVLLPLLSVGGGKRLLTKLKIIKGSRVKTVKPCEHPYLADCPLTTIEEHKKP